MAGTVVNVTIQGISNTGPAFARTMGQLNGLSTAVNRTGSSFGSNRRLIQQFGMQMSDISVQIAGGQMALLALTQNVPQLLQGFGAFGGILAGVVTVLGTLALMMVRTGTSINSVMPLAGILADDFRALGGAITWVKDTFGVAANWIINNLDRLLITATVVGTYFAVTWVAGFVIATAATMTLAGALAFLRTALIRTGIGALLILLGEAVYQLLRVVDAVGTWGGAMSLLGDVFTQVMARIGYVTMGWFYSFKANLHTLNADFDTWALNTIGTFVGWADQVVAVGIGAKDAFLVIWNVIPDALKKLFGDAFDGILMLVHDTIQGLTGMIGGFLEWTGSAMEAMGKTNPFEGWGKGLDIEMKGYMANVQAGTTDIAAGVKTAFDNAFNQPATVTTPAWMKNYFTDDATGSMALAAQAQAQADAMTAAAQKPMTAWNKLWAIISGTDPDVVIPPGTKTGEGGGGGPLEEAGEEVKKFAELVQDTFSSGFDSVFDAMFQGADATIGALKNVGIELLKLAAKQEFMRGLMMIFPGTFGADGFMDMTTKIAPFASGGIVGGNTPSPVPFASGGIVGGNTPSPVPFASGGIVSGNVPSPVPFASGGIVGGNVPSPVPFASGGIVGGNVPSPVPFASGGIVGGNVPSPVPFASGGIVGGNVPSPVPFASGGIVGGNVPSPVPFASGGIVGGNVPSPVPFASGGIVGSGGGIVKSPTYFAMAGGKTGLTGEAGPEAIMPMTNGQLKAVGSNGKSGLMPMTRDKNGDLAVSAPIAFAHGGISRGPTRYARGGVARASEALDGPGGGMGGRQSDSRPAVVMVNIYGARGSVREERSRGPNGEDVRDYYISEQNASMASGKMDKTLQSRLGAKPTQVKR